jgi:hypothetical protein
MTELPDQLAERRIADAAARLSFVLMRGAPGSRGLDLRIEAAYCDKIAAWISCKRQCRAAALRRRLTESP